MVTLQSIVHPFARRFVAGDTAESALLAAQRFTPLGIESLLDYLGEEVRSVEMAKHAAEEYRRLVGLIQSRRVRASVSLKASQMGILLSHSLCAENIGRVAEAAQTAGIRVWMDMEGSALTQATIDVYEVLRRQYKNIGLCLQSALRRTETDVQQLTLRPAALRLCKGAYKEPPSLAFPIKRDVVQSYRTLVRLLFSKVSQGTYPAWATHERTLIQEIIQTARALHISPAQFEFQMLYGVCNAHLRELAHQGFKASVYIPYGTAWLPYFLRRLGERKENVYFLVRNAFSR